MSEIDYEKLAEAVAQRLRLLPPPDQIIWTAEQCAEYLGVSKRHFVDRVSKTYNFPSPIRLPAAAQAGKNFTGHSRWYAAEIQAWVKNHKRAS